jgi:predicted dehydrogenase
MLSRRRFLPAAAAAAAPVVFSRSARAAANDRVTLGFIGVGTQGRGHLGNFLNNKGVEVVAVCDVVKERLDLAKEMADKKYATESKSGSDKGCRAYADFRQLLEHPGLDAVVIATPDHWHAIPAVLACRAKKHVYCEKPLSHDVAEGRRMADAAKKAGVAFQTGSQQRSEFNNRFRAAVEMVWNGWIGDVKRIRCSPSYPARPCDLPTEEVPPGTDWDMWTGPAQERGYNEILCPKGIHKGFPKWRDYEEYGGGMVCDFGAHHYDIAQWMLKMDASGPVKVIPPEDPKTGKGLKYVYANGVELIHNEFEKGPDGKEIKSDVVAEGADGTVLVSRGSLEVRFKTGERVAFPDKPQRVYPSNNHRQNWLDCVKAGKEPICPPEVGHRTATVCHLGNIGYKVGRPLEWDPVKEKFVGDDAANKLLSREPRGKWKA